MKPILPFLLAVLVVSFLSAAPGPKDASLLDAVRRGDSGAMKSLLASNADPNAKDDTGATALMNAALYASEPDMRLLIDAGADVNTANAYGSTALMWAAGDTAKARLLLDRGAAPNARAADRTTALLVAARENNPDAMRLLIAHGTDFKAPSDIANLLGVAYTMAGPDVRRVLAENGVELKAPVPPGAPLLAMNQSNSAVVRTLLDAGADPREVVPILTVTVPTLALAATAGEIETMRLLVAKGADPRAAGSRGWTPLMMAAATSRPDPAVVGFLLEKGADLHARDDVGRTALDWALLEGDTAVAGQLKKAGATAMAPPPAAPRPVSTPRTAAAAIEKAVARLQPAGPVFYEKNKCISCHSQSLPAIAVKLASARGVPVDRALAAHPSEATLAVWKAAREPLLLGNGPIAIGGFAAQISYGLVAMSEDGVAPNAVTDAVARGLAMDQNPDGSFSVDGPGAMRPPLGGASTNVQLTALSIRALTAYAPPGRQADTKARIARALAYLRAAKPGDTQDESFKLLGLIWSGAPASERAIQAKRLLALQRTAGEGAGGWAQLPTLTPDAYATGQALYALHLNGTSPTSGEYRKGAEYLLRTQLEDGTWFVRSRGFAFQPYNDTGFPHGRDQFISSAATSWAAIALAYTL
jgi:ankyrin repeat protein